MANLLREALVALTFPPTLTLALCVLAVALALLRRRRLAILVAVAGIAWSAVWSVPQTSEWLRRSLENRHPVLAEATAPRADAIVVLGGGGHLGWARRPGTRAEDLRYSRLAAGARLWFARRAPVVILSGGGEGGRSEARAMAWAIRTLGVPAQALLLEQRSTDTLGNAVHTAELARRHGVRRVLLVTSAVHMPRAQLLFRRTGLEVVPVPVPEPRVGEGWAQRWIPRPRALRRSGSALKEYVALLGVRLSKDACPREAHGREGMSVKGMSKRDAATQRKSPVFFTWQLRS